MTHALVIGKFYPPHAGHHLLIRAAGSACEAVSVLVLAASHETIALADRVRWLKEVHGDSTHITITGAVDDVPIDYEDPRIWDQHEALMREALERIGAPPVTAVFTSEPYGAELARRFSALTVTVDPERKLAPVSSTQVRNDPAANWGFLAAPVRAALALRVVVVGAESTGKTSLSTALAQHWRSQGGHHGMTRCVPEFGRAYTAQKWANARVQARLFGRPAPAMEDLAWSTDEFTHIARTQSALEEQEARMGGPLLICDTDAFATAIWHERYLGFSSQAVAQLADAVTHALYLVTDHHDVPFEQDGLRDGESIRPWMTGRFLDALSETGRPHALLTGSHGQRLEQAVRATEKLLSGAWRFAPPFS